VVGFHDLINDGHHHKDLVTSLFSAKHSLAITRALAKRKGEQESMSVSNESNYIRNEGASLLARSLGNNALPNLTSLSLSFCYIRDDGFSELVSALEQNTSLLHLDIKVLQEVDLSWCSGLPSAMPLLLIGFRTNTSLFRFDVAHRAPSSFPPTPEETARCAGGWMQEMERLGYRNRFLHLIRAPTERLPHLGLWPHALARVATLPNVIFEVLRSKPKLVQSEDTEGKEDVAEDNGVPKKRK
jgi:hypothetical protein